MLHRPDQVFRSLLDRFQLRHQVTLVIESYSEVGIAVNHGETVNSFHDLAGTVVIQEDSRLLLVDFEGLLS